MYFFALSQAAPPLVIISARNRPVTMAPMSIPPRATGPSRKPTASGATTGMMPGRIISRWAAAVTIRTAGPSDREDRQRAEQERKDAAEEKADDDVRVA